MSSYHHFSLERFGLINDAPSPATRVFTEDPTDDSSASVRQLVETTTSPRDEQYFAGFQSEVGFLSADVDDLPQGDTYMAGRTPVKLVGVAGDFFVQFHDATRLKVAERLNVTEPSLARADYMMRKAGGGRGEHGAIVSRNGLTYLQEEDSNGKLAGGWADTDNNNTPDGYTEADLTSTAFSSGVYEAFVDTNNASRGHIVATIPFPVDGVDVTLSVQWDQLHDDGRNSILIEALDADNSTVQRSVSSIVSSTGRESVTLTTPADTYFLNVYPLQVTAATSETAKARIQNPCLRVDGGTSYVPK